MNGDIAMNDMLEQIVTKLHARPVVPKVDPDTVVPSATEDAAYAKAAAHSNDTGLMKAYLKLASGNRNSFFAVRAAYEALNDYGVASPERYLSEQTVHTYISLWNEIVDMKVRNPEVEANGILCFAMMSGDEDCQLIERIVSEREPVTVDEVRSLLYETKNCTAGLSSGVL